MKPKILFLIALLTSFLGTGLAQDFDPPVPVKAYNLGISNAIYVGFNEEVTVPSATTTANYQVSGGVTVNSVTKLDVNLVRLNTTGLNPSTQYTVSVRNVADLAGNSSSTLVNVVMMNSQGAITARTFSGIFGGSVDDLLNSPQFPGSPDDVSYVTNAEIAGTLGVVGYQLVGFVHPPLTGNYEFYVAGDNTSTRLYVSTTTNESDKVEHLISGDNGFRNFSTPSVQVALEAGKKYYIEALGKRQWGGGSFAIGWRYDSWPAAELVATEFLSSLAPSGPVSIVTQPQSNSVAIGDPLNFSVSVAGTPPYFYQWFKGAAPIAGANARNFGIASASADDAGQYSVLVSNRFSSVASAPATATVQGGSSVPGPHVLSAASVGGGPIGVQFDAALDPITATNKANYKIFGVGPSLTVTSVTLRPDGRSVQIAFSGGALADPFTVKVEGVKSSLGTVMGEPGLVLGAVLDLVVEDIGNPVEAGSGFSTGAGSIEVVAGGLRTWDNTDSFNFVHTQRTGDFDVRVRVDSVQQIGTPGGDPKAALMARANNTPGSPNVSLNVVSTRGYLEYLYRPTQDGGTTEFNPSTSPGLTFPQWIRLKRVGDTFTSLRSSNGVDWVEISFGDVVMPATILVGLNTNPDIDQAGAKLKVQYSKLSIAGADQGFVGHDIGNPIEKGQVSFGEEPGVVDVVAGGLRTWDTTDSFYFVHKTYTNDFDVKVRVNSVTQNGTPGGDPKAALMARADLSPGSPNVSLNVVSTRGYLEYLYRPTQDGGTTEFNPSTSPGLAFPQWIRLRRAGNKFISYRSADGVAWTKISEGEVVMPAILQVGLNTNPDIDQAGATLAVSYSSLGDVSSKVRLNDLGLTATDIGGPIEPGYVTTPAGLGDIDVMAGGLRTWDTSDSFTFVHGPKTNDFDVRVRVDSVQQIGPAGGDPKAALMARANLTPGSPNVSLNVVSTRGYLEYLYRPTQDGGTTEFNPSTSPGLVYPQWIRLQRAGDTFTSFRSTNGLDWVQISSGDVVMPAEILVGLNTNADRDEAGAILSVRYRRFGDTPLARPSPVLAGKREGNQFALSWSVADTGFVLEGKGALSDPTWNLIPGTPTIENNRFTVRVPISGGAAYFRLRSQ